MTNFITNFHGRTSRKDYWLKCVLPVIAAQFSVYFLMFAVFLPHAWLSSEAALSIIYGSALVLAVLTIAPMVRRFHDLGHSGYLLLGFAVAMLVLELLAGAAVNVDNASLLNLIGIFQLGLMLVQFYMLCLQSGMRGKNRFGDHPFDSADKKIETFA